MSERGRILRDTNAGPGLLTVGGKQYTFALEEMWQSELPPKAGMLVDVTFNTANGVGSVRSVPENQIVKEQAAQALRQGSDFAHNVKDKFGLPTIISFAGLILGWFFLTSIEFGRGTIGIQISFWHLLGTFGSLNALQNFNATALASNSMDFYSLLAIASLGGPFLSFFWHDRRATLGGILPLLMMLLTAFLVTHTVGQSVEQASRAMGLLTSDAASRKEMQELMSQFTSQFHLGIGVYVSAIASAYLAFLGLKKYLVAGA